jgi:hypothetical protein
VTDGRVRAVRQAERAPASIAEAPLPYRTDRTGPEVTVDPRRAAPAALCAGLLALTGCATDPYEGFDDRGDPDAVAAVRDAVPRLVEAENRAGRLALAVDGSLPAAENTSPAAVDRRRTEMARAATPERTEHLLGVIDADVARLVGSPDDAALLGYVDADFELDEITGVAVDGDTATAVFRGAECYRALDGDESCDPSDFRLTLRQTTDGAWAISDKISRFLPGQGP